MPSPDGKITCCGVTSALDGKLAGIASGARSRGAADPTTIAGRAGIFASERRIATALPSLVGTGAHSMPVPLVIATGFPPETLTRQMWRRSISP